jgi:type VI secretion system protein ImpM
MAGVTGFFGKLPCHADFVMQRLPRRLIECWDGWIRAGLVDARERLGEEDWLERYLVAPIWRFYWSADVCGESPWLGLFMPSVDSGGRNYPMMVATRLPPHAAPAAVLAASPDWFDRLERILVSSLYEDADIEDFDRLVAQQQLVIDAQSTPVEPARPPWPGTSDAPFTLWWTSDDGGQSRQRRYEGLPEPADYPDFLADASGQAAIHGDDA